MSKINLSIAIVACFMVAVFFQNCSQDMGFATMPSIVPLCQDIGAAAVEPKLRWDWADQSGIDKSDLSQFMQVMATPMAADLNGDKIAEVVFMTWSYSGPHYGGNWYFDPDNFPAHGKNGVLRIVDGKTGKTIKSVGSVELAPRGDSSPLLVDLDADGKIEIIYMHFGQLDPKVIALNHDGSLRWTYNTQRAMPNARSLSAGDFNKDGRSDIIAGGDILTENAVTKQPELLVTLDTNSQSIYSFAMSLNPDTPDELMVVGKSGVFNSSGTKLFSLDGGLQYGAADIYPNNKGIEILGTGGGQLHIYDGVSGELKKSTDLALYDDLLCPNRGSVGGGPPTLGDFDGNPATVEIAVATGRHLVILDANLNLMAKYVTQDCSSLATGISSFDFNGDGQPEILYSDEEYFRIFTMRNGKLEVVWQIVNPSGTLIEYPVVVDLDGDMTAEIVLAANNYAVGGFYKDANETADRDEAYKVTGIRVFEPRIKKSWMPTRGIWHQFDFNPAMVSDRGIASTSTPTSGSFTKDIFRRNAQLGILELKCRSSNP